MKKLKSLLATFLFASSICLAQYYYVPHLNNPGNPGGLNNDNEDPVGGGLDTSWTSIQSGNAISPLWTTQQTIPFSFQFNGNAANDYYVSTSGVLTFSDSIGTAPTYSNMILPDVQIPDNSVMVWGVEGSGINDNIVIKTFGIAPNRQHWITFSSYTISGTTNYEYWSIVLEETSNRIYVVDQRNNNTLAGVTVGIQVNDTNAIVVNNTNTLNAVAGSSLTPSDNNYYEFIFGTQPQFDMTVIANTMYPYQALPLAPFIVKGIVQNAGTVTVTDFSINYEINGGTAVIGNITGVNILPGQTYSFTHPTIWSPTVSGSYSIVTYASNINGNPDQNILNNYDTTSIIIMDQFIQRIPLFEEFTSSTALPCAASNPIFDSLLDANPNKFTCLKYEMNWPGAGDIYYNAMGESRKTYYGVAAIPDLFVDGVSKGDPVNFIQTDFDSEYVKPSFIDIAAYYSVANNFIDIGFTITPLINYTGNMRIYIAVVENPTVNNASTNGETIFHYVEKRIFSPSIFVVTNLSVGTPINNDIALGVTLFSDVENMNNLRAVVWIQNEDTKEVYQSAWAIDTGATAIAPPVCLVSTDSLGLHNQILWDKTMYTNVDSFIVYRYCPLSGTYLRIGAVPFDSLSMFIDTNTNVCGPNGGDPQYSSYKYKVAFRNSFGYLSSMGDYHQSIFYQQNNQNFNWNAYAIENGTTLTDYILMRDDNSNGNWQMVAPITGTATTDPNYSSYPNSSYRIDALGFSCDATRSSQFISHSNVGHNALTVGSKKLSPNSISLSPNPAKEQVIVNSEQLTMKEIKIVDVLNSIIFDEVINAQTKTIDISSFAKGVYTVEVISDNNKLYKKLILE